jgi:hypothetical protein
MRNHMPKKLKRPSTTRSRVTSAIVGGLLLGLSGIWLGWLLLHQFGVVSLPPLPVFSGIPTTQSNLPTAPLTAEGITLGQPNQPPTLSQQQALLMASQLQPDAATKAKHTVAEYVLLNYPNKATPATHADFNNVSAWMIVYQQIPLQPADASVDPTPFPHSYYDLYVFIDSTTGKELVAIQV